MIPTHLKKIVASFNGYMVGGSVRDFLMGRRPCDFDIATGGNAHALAEQIASHYKRRVIKLGHNDQAVFRVVGPDNSFDITPFNGPSIQDDLLKRDFTINAMAYAPSTNGIIDPCGGRNDLTQKRVKMVAPTVFKKDPLRLLRAFRIAAQLGFRIDSETLKTLTCDAPLIKTTAGERIRTEFFGLLESDKAYQYICQMEKSGLLYALLPELELTSGCRQNRHHQYDVLAHTLSAFSHLEILLKKGDTHFTKQARAALGVIDKSRAGLLKCALLLHDIGKPQVKKGAPGRVHFYGHEKKGIGLFKAIAERLRLSKRETDYIAFVIGHHLQPLMLYLSHRQQKLTRKGLARFFSRCDRLTPDLLLHAMADQMGKGPDTDSRNPDFILFINQLLSDFEVRFKPLRTSAPLITGHDLVSIFSLDPSPRFKELLDLVEQAKRSGQITTRKEALNLVAEKLNNMDVKQSP